MFRNTCLAGIVCVILGAEVPAAAPPARPLGSAELQRLIEQLGGRSFRVREQAERRLLAEGLPALPYLKKAVGSRDPEIRKRALRLVPGLELAAMVSPKRVSMAVKNQPLNVVLEEISKQTGYKIINQAGFVPIGGVRPPAARAAGGGKTEEGYSYTFLNAPFWEVMERVCRDTGLTIQQGWGDDTIRLSNGRHSAYGGVDGAFRYTAQNMQLYRNVDLSQANAHSATPPARNETLTFNFMLFCEPRLPFLGMDQPRIEAAYDSERNSMVPRNLPDNDATNGMWAGPGGFRVGRRYYGGGYKQPSLHVNLQLHRVSEKATTLKTLRGVVPVQLLVEQKPVLIADKILSAKGKKTVAGDVEFHIEDVKTVNNQVQIKFTATNKANPGDYNWTNNLQQRVELHDAKGNKYQFYVSNWHGNNGTSVTMTMTGNANGGGVKPGPAERLVFMNWVTRQHDIHFEFRDVPLP